MPVIVVDFAPVIVQVIYQDYPVHEIKRVNECGEYALRQDRNLMWLADTRNVKAPSAQERAAMASPMALPRKMAEQQKKGHLTTVVTNSAVIRGTLTAISWLWREKPLLKPSTSAQDAVEIMRRDGGLALPTALFEAAKAIDEWRKTGDGLKRLSQNTAIRRGESRLLML